MLAIIQIAVIFTTLLTLGFAQGGPGHGKLCDKSLSADKLKQLEACEQLMPQTMKDNRSACLTKLKIGTTFTDFRNTVCDETLGKQFHDCKRENRKAQKKSGPPSEADQEAMKKHRECMKKVFGD